MTDTGCFWITPCDLFMLPSSMDSELMASALAMLRDSGAVSFSALALHLLRFEDQLLAEVSTSCERLSLTARMSQLSSKSYHIHSKSYHIHSYTKHHGHACSLQLPVLNRVSLQSGLWTGRWALTDKDTINCILLT
eukprot:3485874-Pleurochrysis_carterae.AAC.1